MSETENSARPRSDFIYTKNSARPRSDYIYTKIAAQPGSEFIYTNVFGAFLRFLNEKTAYILKNFPAARANWLRNPIRRRHVYLKISRCAGYMVKKSFVNKLKNEGDVMIKSDDFQRKNLSSIGRILGTQT